MNYQLSADRGVTPVIIGYGEVMSPEILVASLIAMGALIAAAKAAKEAKKEPVPVKVEKKTELRRK